MRVVKTRNYTKRVEGQVGKPEFTDYGKEPNDPYSKDRQQSIARDADIARDAEQGEILSSEEWYAKAMEQQQVMDNIEQQIVELQGYKDAAQEKRDRYEERMHQSDRAEGFD